MHARYSNNKGRELLCLSLGFAACKLMLKSNFDSLAPAVSKPHEIVFCHLGICREYSILPIAETKLYGRSKQRTQLLIKLWFHCFVSRNTLPYCAVTGFWFVWWAYVLHSISPPRLRTLEVGSTQPWFFFSYYPGIWHIVRASKYWVNE